MKTEKSNEMKFAKVAGIRMRYRIRGEGFPVIFVHGTMGSIEQEDLLAGDKARLVENYMVVHYDCRGRGKTEAGGYDTKNYAWDGLAEDLWALMRHIGIDRAHLMGGSLGASVISYLAIKRPEAVASLVLHNPIEVRRHDDKYIKGMLDYADFIESEGMDAVTDLILNLPPNDRLQETHPHIIKFYDVVMRSQDPLAVAAATRALVCSAPMTKEQLGAIEAPTLVIAAKGDGLHPTDVGRFLIESIPNARACFGSTITYFSDNPEIVPRRIMEFLSELDGTEWD